MRQFHLIALLLFLGSFLVFKNIYPTPRNWYDHYLYLAKSFLEGRVDVPDLPQFYHDSLTVEGKKVLPFPPVPALILIPFISFSKTITQQTVSILIGALGTTAVFLLLANLTNSKKATALALFTTFGTSYFWASVVGTTWFYAHVVAFLFLTTSLVAHFRRKDFLAGVLFGLAVLSRYPILLGGIFFILELRSERKRLLNFLLGILPIVPVQLLYNYVRFGDIFRTGYYEVFLKYATSPYPYTILQVLNPDTKVFGYLDPRNIPLHLYTFFLMPPEVSGGILRPSPYGMGILFTSPFLLLAFKPPFKKKLELALIAGALAIALVDFLHYMQGWVQFGYRFLIDFLPFLVILLALRLKLSRAILLLILVSIVVNTWGVVWAVDLGW